MSVALSSSSSLSLSFLRTTRECNISGAYSYKNWSTCSQLDRAILELPVHLVGLGTRNPCLEANREYTSSVEVTLPLVQQIISQSHSNKYDIWYYIYFKSPEFCIVWCCPLYLYSRLFLRLKSAIQQLSGCMKTWALSGTRGCLGTTLTVLMHWGSSCGSDEGIISLIINKANKKLTVLFSTASHLNPITESGW